LIVEEELAQAVRCESVVAVSYWWGIGRTTVAKWRKALDVTRQNNEGSQVLIHAATAKALEAAREVGVSPEECAQRSERARVIQPWRFFPPVPRGHAWTEEDIALLGTMRDSEVARWTEHTIHEVRHRRRKEGIPPYSRGTPVGATCDRRTGRWCASISVQGKHLRLGTYDTKEAAQQAVRVYR
jgi:hypothetical protein